MSNFGDPNAPQQPPPPGPYASSPPPPPFAAQPPPPPGAYAPPPGAYTPPPPGYQGYGAPVAGKPPRPNVSVGSVLLIVGAAIVIAGAFVTWFTVKGNGESLTVNGFTKDGFELKSGGTRGGVFVFYGVVLAGFGIAMLAAKRVLAVAILAVIFAALTVISGFSQLSDVSDVKKAADIANQLGTPVSFSYGAGVPLIIIGSFIALGGGIATLAKRRR